MNTKRSIKSVVGCMLAVFGLGMAPSDAAAADTLRVVSYNIHHGQGMDGKMNLERIAKVLAAQKPDLIALQEVDKNCKRSGKQDIARKLAELLGMEYRFGKAINLQGGEYGNAILSKLPIKEFKNHPLPKSSEPRAALEVVVEHNGQPLSFVSLHLERNSGTQRNNQVKALLGIFSKRKHGVILAGDFNAARWAEPMKLVQEGGWSLLKKNDGKDIRTFHGEKKRADSATEARVEIDYVATRGLKVKSVQHGVVPEKMASDHRPVYAVFQFGK